MKYQFIGWCKEGRHDKVWICIRLSEYGQSPAGKGVWGKSLTLWGRRGGRLRSKIVDDDYNLERVIQKKQDHGGYRKMSESYLDKNHPKLKAYLEKQYIWSTLTL